MRIYPFPDGLKLLETDPGYFALVAADFIGENYLFGVAFVKDERPMPLIRTALGAFLAHSDEPNCMLETRTKYWQVWSIKDLYVHDELTINYNLYGLR